MGSSTLTIYPATPVTSVQLALVVSDDVRRLLRDLEYCFSGGVRDEQPVVVARLVALMVLVRGIL